MQSSDLFFALAYVLMFLGVLGAILPIVPGPILIWLGALLWAYADGFQAVGWPTLVVLGGLMLLAWSSDLILITVGSRKAGASWKAVAGAITGGIVGGVLLSGVPPVLGTVLGAMLGGVMGLLVVAYYETRDWDHAFQVSKGYILGYLATIALQLVFTFLMVAIFAWQAFF